MTWRWRELLVDSLRNLGLRQVGTGIIVVLVLTVFGTLTATQAQNALKQTWERNAAGGLVWTATAATEYPLDGATCDYLSRFEGVAASGGTLQAIPESFRRFTKTPVLPAKGITPNMLKVWSIDAPINGIIVGRDLESIGALSVGSTIVSDKTGLRTTVTGRTSSLVRPEQLSSSLLIISHPDQPLSDCWIRMKPGASTQAESLLRYVFASTQAVQYAPYLSPATGVATPSEQWHVYADSQPWIAVAALTALIIVLGAWSQRSAIAIYGAFGTPKSIVSLFLAIDAIFVLLPATAIAIILALIIPTIITDNALGNDTIVAILRSLCSASLLAFALATPLSLLVTRGRISDQLKDK